MRKLFFYLFISLCIFSFNSCKKSSDVSYPYEEYELVYMGIESGLTSSSSDEAFSTALNSVMQDYADKNSSSSTELTFDAFKYELTNLQDATGGVSDKIWDNFWDKLDEYSYSIGSCWGFSYVNIPERGKTGTVCILYAIVKDDYEGVVRYVAVKGNVSPKGKTRTDITDNDLYYIIKNSHTQIKRKEK